MKRAIVLPADVSGAPLNDLRKWLGMSNNNEEALLLSLLRASLEMCEAFTGQMPLESQCEEVLAIAGGWQCLSARPVTAITGIEIVADDSTRQALASTDYEIEIDPAGVGRVAVSGRETGRSIAVRYTAGLADNWYGLPEPLKHGIIRLAAHNFRDRDATDPLGPPASVAALWRPWRSLRLA